MHTPADTPRIPPRRFTEASRPSDDSGACVARALEAALVARDPSEAGHMDRAAAYAVAIAGRVAPELLADPAVLAGIRLHDIGKIALPDTTLFRRGPLTARDWRLLHRHPLMGADIVSATGALDGADAVVRSHHERWDGHGYPAKLTGTEIPLAARVFAVADTLDAITTDRPHRLGKPLGSAREAIRANAGGQFDPGVVEAFEALTDAELEDIRFAAAG